MRSLSPGGYGSGRKGGASCEAPFPSTEGTVGLFGLAVKLCHGEAVGNAAVAFGVDLQAFVNAFLVGHYVRGGDNGKCAESDN